MNKGTHRPQNRKFEYVLNNTKSFSFVGNGAGIDFDDVLRLGNTTNRTFVFWVYLLSNTDDNCFFSKGTSDTYQYHFRADANTGTLRLQSRNGSSNNLTVITPDSLATNTWYMMALVKSGANSSAMKIYKDGVLLTNIVVSGSSNAWRSNNSGHFNMGKNHYSQQILDGYINMFTVWNKALSQSELLELRDENNKPVHPNNVSFKQNLIFYPDAETATAGTNKVLDLSSSNYKGTFEGAATTIAVVP